MSKSWIAKACIALATTLSLVATATVANAATGPQGPQSVVSENRAATVRVTSETYSDRDIIALTMFGKGRIADAYPELARKLVPAPADGISDDDIDAVVAALLDIEPNFNGEITVQLQSGDPYEVQEAIQKFRAIVGTLAEQQAPGNFHPDCVGPTLVFVAGFAVVFIAVIGGAVGVTIVAAYNAYLPEETGTEFDLQAFSAEIARTLK